MKTILKVGGIILILLAVVLVVLTLSLNSNIKAGVENIGPTITGTDVTLDDVDLSLFSGEGQLENLVIGNPPGFQSQYAFFLGRVRLKGDFQSIWSDTIHIQEIVIDSPEISFESTPEGSNISIIRDNIGKFGRSDSESGPPPGQGKSEHPGKRQETPSTDQKIQIDQFMIKNGRITLSTPLLKDQMITIGLPVVQIRDIGKQSGGITVKEISSLIFSETEKAIERELDKSGIPLASDLKQLDKKLGDIMEDASDFLKGMKGLFGK